MLPQICLILVLIIQASPPVSVAVDRDSYNPGELVSVVVHVTSVEGVNANAIWVFVDKPNGCNLNYTWLPATGGSWVFRLPRDAPYGKWTVTVSWNHEYVSASFLVIKYFGQLPEFSTPAICSLTIVTGLLAVLHVHSKRD